MTAMTATPIPVGAWTLVYTAAADITVYAHNASPSVRLRMRIGSAAVVGDALTAAAMSLACDETRPLPLKNTDKVFMQPIGVDAGAAVIWA